MQRHNSRNCWFVEIPLTKGKVALVSLIDAEQVNRFKWTAKLSPKSSSWYAQRAIWINGKSQAILLHRFILNAPDDEQVDHANGDGLDNRRCNLRLASNQTNHYNMRPMRHNRTGFKGVTQSKNGTYEVRCTAGKHRRWKGGFQTPEEAARAYDSMAREMHGSFAWLNFPD